MTVNYVYGADGERAVKYSRLGETLYFDSMWVVCPDRREQMSKNVYVGEVRVATRVNARTNGSVAYAVENTYYYHSDHVGSAQLVTDYRGEIYERIEYTPYGEVWIESKAGSGLYSTPYRFTGNELDEETGLYYYGARYLDPKTSRWISSDPALGEYVPVAPVSDEARKHNQSLPGMGGVYNLVNLQLYHYAGNNPVKYIDPDGRRILIADELALISHVIGFDASHVYINDSVKGRAYSLPWNYIGINPNPMGSIWGKSLLVHEAFHQQQYSENIFCFFVLVGEQILYKLGVDVYDYNQLEFISGKLTIKTLRDIHYLEAQAQFVQDFTKFYLEYKSYLEEASDLTNSKTERDFAFRMANLKYRIAQRYAQVLYASGKSSAAIFEVKEIRELKE
ncbi:RHS repeat-associated core domain-containing protein [Spirochaetia bacterium 38H-sp]|uniref:RHS repeat-associated core domain-containing protein n=1 Tax=Rarispira pelagica TaxID=3141764 RepID=A0ABU9UE45_9SPIR